MIEQLFSIPVATGTIVPTDEQLSKSLSFLDEAWAVANRGVWANETGKSNGELKQGQELLQQFAMFPLRSTEVKHLELLVSLVAEKVLPIWPLWDSYHQRQSSKLMN